MQIRFPLSLAGLLALLAAGCAEQNIPALPLPLQPTAAKNIAPPRIAPPTQPVSESRSVEGRPIEIHRFGTGGKLLLILAGIHGNERNSSTCATLLEEHLHGHPEDLAGISVVIIPAANPDGLAHNTRQNARHVDLNRNFPSRNWTKGGGGLFSGGTAPNSEPETKALIVWIEALKPVRILSIHSMPTPCNNFDGPADALAGAMAAKNGYPVKSSIGYATPGSLGSWAGIDRQIPTITLELPSNLPGPLCWKRNKDAMIAFLKN